MIVFLNGEFVPEEQATISVFDRGFLYGDGLFETIRVYGGRPFLWEQHFDRFARGAKFLGIPLPCASEELRQAASELASRNKLRDAVLRIALSRGSGVRGYSPKGTDRPTLVMTLHPAPAPPLTAPHRWRLVTASFRIPPNEPLAAVKTANKLPHILARAEAESRGADEALLLNTSGEIAEAASGNLFWIENETVCTTPLTSGALPGVTRAFVLGLCNKLGTPAREAPATVETVQRSSGAFMTLSTFGIVEVASLDGVTLPPAPLVQQLHCAYQKAATQVSR